MAVSTAVDTADGLALLPQGVGTVSSMGSLVFGINACAVDEGLEAVLVCPFVDG